jgi:hypothetical protein
MKITLKRRRRPTSVNRQELAEAELVRLWILSLPKGYPTQPTDRTNGKR